ncbi:MAG: hypothetical protein J5800_03690 [Spirochaetales bacterium]|nr:hypothetical protein [Spirochaetales bacterium]
MYEKVNPSHPDKLCDRIAGAIVDLAYSIQDDPKIAVEVLLGHGRCHIITESSVELDDEAVINAVYRITGSHPEIELQQVEQDGHLSENQSSGFRCGDNGIFRGMPLTSEQKKLTELAKLIYHEHPQDGKYIMDGSRVIICQSNATNEDLQQFWSTAEINPLGYWTGGQDVDTGAVNRKLGSDMGDSVTGGGLHGKDLSKADVSVNIYAWLKAQRTGLLVELSCAIGDTTIDGKPYSEIVEIAREYINSLGGFERFAEWGLIR